MVFRTAAALALLAVAALGLCACATTVPVQVNPTFTDEVAPTAARAQVDQNCQVSVIELADGRRSPGILGIVGGRAIKAPEDTTAWLQSILGGLATRGVGVGFDKAAPANAKVVVARVRLQSAWLTETQTNKTANIVLHVRAEHGAAAPTERDYRGGLTKINWNNSDAELQKLVDEAFAEALNEMAFDLRHLCAA